MRVKEFREKIKLGSKIIADGKEFEIEEIVKFRFNDGSFYIKCFLKDNYVLADDSNTDSFVLVKETKNDIEAPFPKKIHFDGKDFAFSFDAHATAEEIRGKEIFKVGESETFWDYEAEDGSYLSLGITDKTKERLDFYGKVIKEVKLA